MNARGIGTMMSARQPSNVPAHCTPRLTNICFEKRGKEAPTADRIMVFAAKTDAALDTKLANRPWPPGEKESYNVKYESIK
jgi:hypothetical protein